MSRLPLIVLSLLLLTAHAGAAEPANTAEATAQALLDALREQAGLPGLSAAVWHDGKPRWQGVSGAGLKAERPLLLASVSKLVTATAAARLQQQGRLDVDAPLSRLLGDEASPAWAAVTPRQLAAHSAGLPHYQLRDMGRGGRHYASNAEAVAELLGNRTLEAAPGQRYQYSSWGYTLLSRVVERAAAQSFEALLPEGFSYWPAQPGQELRGGRLRPVPAHDYSYSRGGAGLAASAASLAAWGGRLSEREPTLLAWMATPARLNDGSPVRDGEYGLGFGWRLQQALDGEPLMHHAGATPVSRTALAVWPQSRMAAALLSDGGNWTSFIVNSAQLLAAPFRAAPAGLVARDCPLQARQLHLTLDQDTQLLPLQIQQQGGRCSASFEAGKTLAALLESASGHAPGRLQLIGIGPGLAHAALITPLGLIELRAQADGSLLGRYGSRRLLLTLA